MTTTQSLELFLERELFALTLAATAQRSDLYASDLSDAARRPFQRSLRHSLEQLSIAYSGVVNDANHLDNIENLALSLSRGHGNVLAPGGMRFGHAQKALNLYLKYLWCLEKVHEPPHFPVDSIILKKIPGFSNYRWTRMGSRDDYSRIIRAAHKVAKVQKLSLACWELKEYKRRDA